VEPEPDRAPREPTEVRRDPDLLQIKLAVKRRLFRAEDERMRSGASSCWGGSARAGWGW
jgi:hypothetical protein